MMSTQSGRKAARGAVAGCAVLGSVAALWCGACAPITSRLVLFPSRGDLELGGAERVMVPDASGAIETIRAKSPGATRETARAIVLRFYGNADRADSHASGDAAFFGTWPVEVWGVNYPGFGRSEGSASLAGVARAADVALGEAQKRGVPVFAMGTSMGSTAALHLSATGKVQAVLLQNPPPLPQLIRGRYGWWNLWLIAGPISWGVPSAIDSMANARGSRVPMVLVSSEQDEIVPFSYQSDVFDAYAGPKERIVVPGAFHNDELPPAISMRLRGLLEAQGWRR